ncbi:MAG: aspartate aminotransferase family protein [Bacteroidales bacterium]|nr:aspartate aminotransferase family protein [Bacteroidales bacterium]
MTEKRDSSAIYKTACEVLPGGISRNTVFRKPHPDYVSKASGCHITDIEGIERIDFANNMASLIHGHAHPDIINAVFEQMKNGTAYTMASEIEVEYAKYLCHRVDSFDKIRFVNSGTEAVMAMIKAARAFTGRAKIAKAEGAYHGTYDFAEVSQTANPANWGDIDKPNSVPVAFGTPQSVLDEVIVFPYNDIERTLNLLNKHSDSIACVLLDPVPHRVGLLSATNEFVEAVYNWTRKNGALLLFDEVVTFRVNYGGTQQNYKVKPDLTALGKIIGGGFPVGAFGGRSDIMNLLDPRVAPLLFPHSGTFSANPVTLTAGYTAMQLFEKDAVIRLNELTKKAIYQIEEAVKIADVPVFITGAGSMFRMHLTNKAPTTYRDAYQNKEVKNLIDEILDYLYYKENMLLINTLACMFSTALTQNEVDKLSEALLRAFKLMKAKFDNLKMY